MPSGLLPKIAVLVRHVPSARQLSGHDVILLFCNESHHAQIRPRLIIKIAIIIPDRTNSFVQVFSRIPDKKNFSLKLTPGIGSPSLEIERLSSQSNLNRLRSCDDITPPAFLYPDGFAMPGAFGESSLIIVASKSFPDAMLDGRKCVGRFEHRYVSGEVVWTAFHLPSRTFKLFDWYLTMWSKISLVVSVSTSGFLPRFALFSSS